MMLDAAVAAASDISLLLSWEIMGAWRAGRVCSVQCAVCTKELARLGSFNVG